MKQLAYCTVLLLVSHFSFAQKRPTVKVEKMWETDTAVRVPESVLYDAKRQQLFVSLIDGAPWDADGKGGIAKLSLDGITLDQDWVKGLNCPKGMGVDGNKLYVADLGEVVVVNIKKGVVESRIKPAGAENLNDIIVTPQGVLFVSDSKLGKIFRIENGKPELYIDSLPGINGLHFANSMLLAGAGKSFVRFNTKKEPTVIATLPQSIDGIEPIGNGDYLVTSWSGYIYYLFADGTFTTLVDTHEQKKNTADIGYNPQTGMLYVPTFFGKTVAAYKMDWKMPK